MKTTRYMLLIIGNLGLITAVLSIVSGSRFTDQIMTLVCSLSLIYGYYALQKTRKAQH